MIALSFFIDISAIINRIRQIHSPLLTIDVVSTRMSPKTISTLVNIRCKANNRRFFRITSRIVTIAVILHSRISSRVFLRVLLFLRPDHHPHEEEEDDHRVRSLPPFKFVYQTHRSFTVSISPFTITFQFHYLHHHLHSFLSAISPGFISYFYYHDIYLASLVILCQRVFEVRRRIDRSLTIDYYDPGWIAAFGFFVIEIQFWKRFEQDRCKFSAAKNWICLWL